MLPSLLSLPVELQALVFQHLDANSLGKLGAVCKDFRTIDKKSLSLVERAARDNLERKLGAEQAGRWRYGYPTVAD